MAYQGKLQDGQTIILENQDDQTIIRVSSSGQSQSSSVSTGRWQSKPTLFQTEGGAMVEINTESGSSYYAVKGGQLQSLSKKPDLSDAKPIDLKEVDDGTGQSGMKPMKEMEPMKPM